MRIKVSENLNSAIPTFKEEVDRTIKIACDLDSDIKASGLFIQAQCHRYFGWWCGMAWPTTWTYFKRTGDFIEHIPGRIDLQIGIDTDPEDRISLVAHELRHIGQFHRGLKLHNWFGAEHMDDCEADAEYFEELVLERLPDSNSR